MMERSSPSGTKPYSAPIRWIATLASPRAASTLSRTACGVEGRGAGRHDASSSALPVRGAASRVPRSGRRWSRPETPSSPLGAAGAAAAPSPSLPSRATAAIGPGRRRQPGHGTPFRRPRSDRREGPARVPKRVNAEELRSQRFVEERRQSASFDRQAKHLDDALEVSDAKVAALLRGLGEADQFAIAPFGLQVSRRDHRHQNRGASQLLFDLVGEDLRARQSLVTPDPCAPSDMER